MIVYLLFHETNTGDSDDSDGYVEEVYANKADADAACLAAIRKARDEGTDIWMDPDDPEDEGDPHWTDDWRVIEHDVIGSAPCATCEAVKGVLQDDKGEWRELQSCADAVQEICLVFDTEGK